ncbi:hypothetical protein Tco_0293681, partial [Tanacetum coccineum]
RLSSQVSRRDEGISRSHIGSYEATCNRGGRKGSAKEKPDGLNHRRKSSSRDLKQKKHVHGRARLSRYGTIHLRRSKYAYPRQSEQSTEIEGSVRSDEMM